MPKTAVGMLTRLGSEIPIRIRLFPNRNGGCARNDRRIVVQVRRFLRRSDHQVRRRRRGPHPEPHRIDGIIGRVTCRRALRYRGDSPAAKANASKWKQFQPFHGTVPLHSTSHSKSEGLATRRRLASAHLSGIGWASLLIQAKFNGCRNRDRRASAGTLGSVGHCDRLATRCAAASLRNMQRSANLTSILAVLRPKKKMDRRVSKGDIDST